MDRGVLFLLGMTALGAAVLYFTEHYVLLILFLAVAVTLLHFFGITRE
jgi:hypothetical protein